MPQRITDFLIVLASNPSEIDAYQKDPGAYLDDKDLSEEHKDVLISQDPARINEAIAKEAGVFAQGSVNIRKSGGG